MLCDRCECKIDYMYVFPGKTYLIRTFWCACYVAVGFLFGLIVGR